MNYSDARYPMKACALVLTMKRMHLSIFNSAMDDTSHGVHVLGSMEQLVQPLRGKVN